MHSLLGVHLLQYERECPQPAETHSKRRRECAHDDTHNVGNGSGAGVSTRETGAAIAMVRLGQRWGGMGRALGRLANCAQENAAECQRSEDRRSETVQPHQPIEQLGGNLKLAKAECHRQRSLRRACAQEAHEPSRVSWRRNEGARTIGAGVAAAPTHLPWYAKDLSVCSSLGLSREREPTHRPCIATQSGLGAYSVAHCLRRSDQCGIARGRRHSTDMYVHV